MTLGGQKFPSQSFLSPHWSSVARLDPTIIFYLPHPNKSEFDTSIHKVPQKQPSEWLPENYCYRQIALDIGRCPNCQQNQVLMHTCSRDFDLVSQFVCLKMEHCTQLQLCTKGFLKTFPESRGKLCIPIWHNQTVHHATFQSLLNTIVPTCQLNRLTSLV